ncbi:MAG: thioredoxin family protein [Actinobacteria bacterium]|nr:MAG: thioredoxin family protein [Actinomycetota bacterium]
MKMKPVVDRLTKEFEGKVEVRRFVDSSPEGDKLAEAFGVQYVPTFVFVNSDGSTAGMQVGEMTEVDLRARMDALK